MSNFAATIPIQDIRNHFEIKNISVDVTDLKS